MSGKALVFLEQDPEMSLSDWRRLIDSYVERFGADAVMYVESGRQGRSTLVVDLWVDDDRAE